MIKEGEFIYRVVNAEEFDKVADEYDRRERDKFRKREERAANGKEGSTRNNEGSSGQNGTVRELWVDACKVYEFYPRKVGKQAAVRKIAAGIGEFGFEKVLEATKLYAKAWEGAMDLKFCPHPATWFGQHRFNDDPATWVRNEGKKLPESREIHEEIEIPKL